MIAESIPTAQPPAPAKPRPARPDRDDRDLLALWWRGFYAGAPLDAVQESHAAAGWFRGEAERAPNHFPAGLRDLLREIEAETARELAARAAPPATAPRADLAAIKQRIDLAAYIETRTGATYRRQPNGALWTRCPFPDHLDREPSFRVNPDDRRWKCWGCGRGGDVFTFHMEWTGDDFGRAVRVLAAEAGVPLPDDRAAARRQPDRTDGAGFLTLPSGAVLAPIRGGGRRHGR